MKIKKYSGEKNGSTLSKKALSYAAMTGAFLAVSEKSDGQVIYTDVNPDRVVISPDTNQWDLFPIDYDNDGIADIVIQHYKFMRNATDTTKIAWAGTFSQTVSTGAPVPLVNRANRIPGTQNTFSGRVYLYPSVLATGSIISAGVPNMQSFYLAHFQSIQTLNWISSGQYGQWLGRTGFMGEEFISGSNTFYGWVEMDVDSAASRVIVKGYAYESTPGALIHAGDIGVGVNEHRTTDGSYFLLSNNPSSHNAATAVMFSSNKPQSYKIEIVNYLGEVVSTQSAEATAGNNGVKLQLDNVAAGNYIIRLTLGDSVRHHKLVVAD